MHSMRVRKGKKCWMAVKINMEKANNRLQWGFIRDTLKDVRLLSQLIKTIM